MGPYCRGRCTWHGSWRNPPRPPSAGWNRSGFEATIATSERITDRTWSVRNPYIPMPNETSKDTKPAPMTMARIVSELRSFLRRKLENAVPRKSRRLIPLP